jgi:hypothetical protein
MSFKPLQKWIMASIMVAVGGLLNACAVNEGPPKEKVKDISKQSLKCLSTLRADLENYFNGDATDERINNLYTCSLKALQTFKTQTQGESAGKFTAEEIRNFLSRYFLDDLKISDNLLHEVMLVKKALLGGKDTDFSYSDLDSTAHTLDTIRQMMIRLNPYMPFSFKRLQGESDAYVNNAGAAIQDVAAIFADVITQKNTVYALSDMSRLFSEITKQFPTATTLLVLQEKTELTASLKQFLISPNRSRDEVRAEEWKIMLSEGAKWFSIFMRFRQLEFQHPDYLTNPESEARFASLISEALVLTRNVVSRHDQGITFESIDALLKDILVYFPEAATIKKIHSNLDTIASLKKLVVSPNSPRDRISVKDWAVVEKDGVSWLKLWLKYDALSKEANWSAGTGRKQLESIGRDLFPMLDLIVNRHGGLIAFETLRKNMEIIPEDSFPKGLTIKTLQSLLPTVVRRILGGSELGIQGRKALGLNPTGVKNLKGLFDEWMVYNRYIEGLYLNLARGEAVHNHMAFDVEALRVISIVDALKLTGEVTDQQAQWANEFKSQITDLPAFLAPDTRGIVFDGGNYKRPRVYADLYQRTWMRALFKRVIQGYMEGSDLQERLRDPNKFGLKRAEFINLIADYWQILVDFKLVGKENSPEIDGNKRFLESSLFMIPSDGNKLISMGEGSQLLSFMVSASPMGKAGHRYAIAHCQTGEVDEFGQLEVEPECYRRSLYDARSSNPATKELWSNFPLFVQYLDSLDDEDRELFLKRIEAAARRHGYQKDVFVNSSDSDSLFMLVHYIESVYLRFDSNQSGGLAYREAKVAFEVFKLKLAEVTGFDPDSSKLKSVFAWLLDKGEAPTGSASFIAWHLKGLATGTWAIHAERSNLYSVLSEINKMKAPSPATAVGTSSTPVATHP